MQGILLQSWLNLVCRMITDLRVGLVAYQTPGAGALETVAVWPQPNPSPRALAAAARSTNSWTASESAMVETCEAGSGKESGGTAYTCSPRTRARIWS